MEKRSILIDEVVSGGAKGADLLGEQWAKLNKIPVKRFVAEWEIYGKIAGPIRNQRMANYCEPGDILIAFDTGGPGTANMIETAKKRGMKVIVVKCH